jgi:uncharacterized membrane protein YeiH
MAVTQLAVALNDFAGDKRVMNLSIPPLLVLFDLAAVAVFAVTGALVAARKGMDPFGFGLLATATGIGGGTLRDVLLDLRVFWIAQPIYVVVCLVAATATFFLAHHLASRTRGLIWLDAVGLIAFAVLGADKALDQGTGPFIAVVMGVISAAFGGIIRDVLGGESPMILRSDIYATAALLAAVAYVGAVSTGVPTPVAASGAFALGFALRSAAIRAGWSLPGYRARPDERD